MDDGRFRVLFHTMKVIEGSIGDSLENAIVRIIDTFRNAMTEGQRKEALEEFDRYEKLRKEQRGGRIEGLLEEEKYRELVHREPFKEETEDWW